MPTTADIEDPKTESLQEFLLRLVEKRGRLSDNMDPGQLADNLAYVIKDHVGRNYEANHSLIELLLARSVINEWHLYLLYGGVILVKGAAAAEQIDALEGLLQASADKISTLLG